MTARPAPPQPRTTPKPVLNHSMDPVNPQQWLNFSLPPRVRGPALGNGVPRRSRRGEGWRSSAMTREKYVNASFRFVLKPTQSASYGAHFADPDISLHWPNILQVLVPTFSALSVAQGLVSSDPSGSRSRRAQEISEASWDEEEVDGEESAERRRRIEEEKMGRSCPICLGKPVAGRMTKCGHIFCFPCILHYIQLSDIPKSAKCPICGDTIHEGMLKSVRYLDASQMLEASKGNDEEPLSIALEDDHEQVMGDMDDFPSVPSTSKTEAIHMRLIERPQMSTLSLPTSATFPSNVLPPHTTPFYFLPDILSFSRFMLATPSYMFNELSRELAELAKEYEALKGDSLGRDFVNVAKAKVERQVGKVRAELDVESVKREERETRETWGEVVGGERRERERKKERERKAREREENARLAKEREVPVDIPVEFLASQQNGTLIPPNLIVSPNPMPPKKNRRKPNSNFTVPSVPTQPSPSYYFYQSSLGLPLFLHPLDIRILLSHFKSYTLFPTTLSFTSTGYDTATITDELRKRYKYLSHLPIGTEVVFIEAELEDIVGKDGLKGFEVALKGRRGRRKEKGKKEDKAKERWEKMEREKLPLQQRESPPARDRDREFLEALEKSQLEAVSASWGSASSSTGPPAHPLQHTLSFASALHSAHAPPARGRREEVDWEVEEAWMAFERMPVGVAEGGGASGIGIKESEKGGGA
ncbi:hypothetical protein P7C73_g6539, partial [Tremellales sp. Uapishka_1]